MKGRKEVGQLGEDRESSSSSSFSSSFLYLSSLVPIETHAPLPKLRILLTFSSLISSPNVLLLTLEPPSLDSFQSSLAVDSLPVTEINRTTVVPQSIPTKPEIKTTTTTTDQLSRRLLVQHLASIRRSDLLPQAVSSLPSLVTSSKVWYSPNPPLLLHNQHTDQKHQDQEQQRRQDNQQRKKNGQHRFPRSSDSSIVLCYHHQAFDGGELKRLRLRGREVGEDGIEG